VLDTRALQAHLRTNLAPYKQPAHVQAVSEFPMTGNGKVLKRELLRQHAAPFSQPTPQQETNP
jgi:acyl-coenzyme A synthetase/AMP-(fatty) acid ligase